MKFICVYLFLLTHFIARAEDIQQAAVSCNAKYSAPCARQNSEWLATTTATLLETRLEELSRVTEKDFNIDSGFYPFVFDRTTAVCVAHGANPDLVGLTLEEIFLKFGIASSDTNALHARFQKGGWVRYLWSDEASVNSKLAFVTNVTDRYYLGVGYENKQLPVNLPCSDKFDEWCAINNVRSLVGAAQFELEEARSLEAFEATLFELSYNDDDFKIPGGFYPFLYDYSGKLKAHGVLHGSLGRTLPEIFVDKNLGSSIDGAALNRKFVAAVEERPTAWVQYDWLGGTKIAFLVRIQFEEEQYYLGVGFNFALDDLPPGPSSGGCSANYNLPCAFQTSFQLSSHTLAHAISSPDPLNTMFDAVSRSDSFKKDDFYVFIYNFNSTCVAHGRDPSFVGLSLSEVFERVNFPLDATTLHDQFRTAAKQGGGWVLYNWVTPTM